MNWARFNIDKAVSSFVAHFSGGLQKIAIGKYDLGATALDIIETTQSVTHLKQKATVGRLG